MKLKDYLERARALKAGIQRSDVEKEHQRIRLLLLLVELRGLDLIWSDAYPTWDALLRAEKLCARATYYRFESALRLLTLGDVQRFGVTASTAIQMTPPSRRQKLIDATRQWYKSRNRPNHTEVARFVRGAQRKLSPLEEVISRGRLLRYIEALKKKLRDNGLRPPKMA